MRELLIIVGFVASIFLLAAAGKDALNYAAIGGPIMLWWLTAPLRSHRKNPGE